MSIFSNLVDKFKQQLDPGVSGSLSNKLFKGKVGDSLVGLQNFIESPTSRIKFGNDFKYNPSDTDFIKGAKIGGNLLKGFGESLINEPFKIGSDIGRIYGNQYNTKYKFDPASYSVRLGQNITNYMPVYGNKPLNPLATLGNYGAGKWNIPLTNIKLPEFGLSESPLAETLGLASGATEPIWAAVGGKNPGAVASYLGLSGVFGGAGEAFNGGSFQQGALASMTSQAPKAISAAGFLKATNPVVDYAGQIPGLGAFKLPAKSAANVLQGVAFDKTTGMETTPTSMLIDALFPVAEEVGSKIFKSAPEAIRYVEAKIAKKLGIKLRDKGMFRSDDQFTKGTRTYKHTGKYTKYASGMMLGFEPYQDENGRWQVRFNKDKAAFGLALAIGGTELLGKADDNKQMDDMLKQADDAETKPLDIEEYVKEQTTKMADARQTDNAGGFKNLLKEIRTKFVDSLTPIEDVLDNAEKQYGFRILPQNDVRLQADRVLRSNSIASQYMKDNGLIDVIQKVPDMDRFDQYLIAKQASDVAENGIETGRDLVKDKQLVDALAPEYEPFAQQIKSYTEGILDQLTKAGIISVDTATHLKNKYPNYVPLNRIFSEDEIPNVGTSKQIANLGQQKSIKKLVGSTREIESPLYSLVKNTFGTINEIERNKAANMLISYKDLPENPFNLSPLRTAENVQKRIDIYTEAKELGKGKNALERLMKSDKRNIKDLERELNALNKLGIDEYLKRPDIPEVPTVQANLINVIKTKIKSGTVETDTGKFKIKYPESTSTLEYGNNKLSKKEFKTLINDFVNEPPAKVDMIKQKITNKNRKLAPLLEDLKVLTDEVNYLKTRRANLFDEARLLKDASSKHKATISAYKNGIKEVYEVDKDVADAAKQMDVESIGLLGKIASFPTRLLQATATGLNIPFVLSNYLKDQQMAFITSDQVARTSMLNPLVFLKGLYSAAAKDDLFDMVNREGGLATSFDIARGDPEKSLGEIRAGKSLSTSTAYTVTHPMQLLKTFEDIVGTTEQATRIQQFKGTYDAYKAMGASDETARLFAAQAARENTANFFRKGEWGKVLNRIIPFFNAGIQGARSLRNAFSINPKGTAFKIASTVMIPAAAVTLWNLSDEKRKKIYDNILDYEKEANLILVPDNVQQDEKGRYKVIKIPINPGLQGFTNTVRTYIEGGQKLDKTFALEALNNAFSTYTSLDLKPRKLASQVFPQLLKVGAEPLVNQNLYTGKQIIPNEMRFLEPQDQVYPWTSGTLRIIGKALNVSPLVIENIVSTAASGVGRQMINASDKLLNKFGLIPDEQVGGESAYQNTIRRFTLAEGGQKLQDFRNETTKGMTKLDTSLYDFLKVYKDKKDKGTMTVGEKEWLQIAENALKLSSPKVEEALRKESQIRALYNNEPENPFNQESEEHRKTIMILNALPDRSEEKRALTKANNDWLQSYWDANEKYFASKAIQTYETQKEQLASTGNLNGQFPKPKPSVYVQQQMDLKNWKDPQVIDYLNKNTAYNNYLRESMGLLPMDKYGNLQGSGSGGYQQKLYLSKPKTIKAKMPKTSTIKIKGSKLRRSKASRVRKLKPVKRVKLTSFKKFVPKTFKINAKRV